MIDKVNAQQCVICGSCVNICPKGAISLEKKYLDFSYPEINFSKCIRCNQCEQHCPVLHAQVRHQEGEPIAYAARNRKENVRKVSTSGGVFASAAEYVLSQNGFVCGAVFDADFSVKHICTNAPQQIRDMMGSKYAQSDMGDSFQQVKEKLQMGKLVLFTGCPCQIAGLNAFLGKSYENLILMELICHGIPSAAMLKSYIQLLETRFHAALVQIQFCDKTGGWHNRAVSAKFSNGKVYRKPTTADGFMRGLLGNTYLKTSCYGCPFRGYKSGADLMMGDFWGAEAEMPEIDDNTGLSAILVTSSRGNDFFQKLELDKYAVRADQIIRYNKNIINLPQPDKNREKFYQLAREKGFSQAIDLMLCEKRTEKWKRQIRFGVRSVLYRITGRGKPLY